MIIQKIYQSYLFTCSLNSVLKSEIETKKLPNQPIRMTKPEKCEKLKVPCQEMLAFGKKLGYIEGYFGITYIRNSEKLILKGNKVCGFLAGTIIM